MSTPALDYDGRVFVPAEAGGAERPGDIPTGHYHHRDDLVWAEFAGGPVRSGRLVGRCASDGTITGGYCQLGTDGSVVTGSLTSRPSRLADGRLMLAEHWQRADGSSGISHIVERDDGHE